MPIYESRRAVICAISDLALTKPPSLSELIDDLGAQLGELQMKKVVVNIMQLSSKSFVLHFASSEQVQELIANGLSFCKHPLALKMAKASISVTLERVPYGIPSAVLVSTLTKYGEVKGARTITYKGYGLSKHVFEAVLKTDIPSPFQVIFILFFFSSQNLCEENQEYFLSKLDSFLDSEASDLCEGDLTFSECFRALNGMAHGKSPGFDFFPAEFYSRFWELIGPDLVSSFNYCFRRGKLPFS